MAEDFLSYCGYELPDDLPTQVEVQQQGYYQHPAGTYQGFIGRIVPKYKNLEGKNCSKEEVGASMSHLTLRIYLQKFLGTTQAPVNQELLNDALTIPEGKTSSELYFPVNVSFNPSEAWRSIKQFEKFELPNAPESKIIQISPVNPMAKIIIPKNFPKYYGMKVNFDITFKAGSEKQSRYIDGNIQLIQQRLPMERLQEFEKEFEQKIEAEIEARKAERNNPSYVPPTTDFGAILDEDPADAYKPLF